MTDIYEMLVEDICEDCAAATDDCVPGCWKGESRCRFWGDMEELKKRCDDLSDWVKLVIRSARNYDEYDDELAALNI